MMTCGLKGGKLLSIHDGILNDSERPRNLAAGDVESRALIPAILYIRGINLLSLGYNSKLECKS